MGFLGELEKLCFVDRELPRKAEALVRPGAG
jgi:hypothetical protein